MIGPLVAGGSFRAQVVDTEQPIRYTSIGVRGTDSREDLVAQTGTICVECKEPVDDLAVFLRGLLRTDA